METGNRPEALRADLFAMLLEQWQGINGGFDCFDPERPRLAGRGEDRAAKCGREIGWESSNQWLVYTSVIGCGVDQRILYIANLLLMDARGIYENFNKIILSLVLKRKCTQFSVIRLLLFHIWIPFQHDKMANNLENCIHLI